MNLVYQTLYPASLLPWFIICLFYLVKGHIFLFLLLATHVGTHATVIFHIPGLKMNMVEWNRTLHMQRLGLWLTYAIRNQYPSIHFIYFSLFLAMGNVLLVRKYKDKIMNMSIHTLFVLCFCSSANIFQIIVAIACCVAFYFIKQPMSVQWDMHDKMKKYYLVRMAYTYMFSIIEWSVSDMNYTSLFVMILASLLFNACVLFTTPKQTDEKKDEWYVPKSLPEDYPYPLNIKDAIERCNIAKKLFKSHEL